MYFKFAHKTKGTKSKHSPEMYLPNKYQDQVIEELLKVMEKDIKTCKKCKISNETQTYLPYYDSIIEKKDKQYLCEVKMNPITHARVLNQTLIHSVTDNL